MTKPAADNLDTPAKPRWALPWQPTPSRDAKNKHRIRAAQIAAYTVLVVMLVAPIVQSQANVCKKLRRAEKEAAMLRDYQARADAGTLTEKEKLAPAPKKGNWKRHKGAIGRWRKAIRRFWAGHNIYYTGRQYDQHLQAGGAPQAERSQVVALHPNMPIVVILLTPFAYLPVAWEGLLFAIFKAGIIVASLFGAVAVCNHRDKRMPDWVVALGIAFAGLVLVSDLQHGNTNILVLGAIVLHAWLYRQGRDVCAGASLALAVCLKLTPGLFLLYWLYQRNWKLLAGAAGAGLILVVLLPATLLGPTRAFELTSTWAENLILPAVQKGAPYPEHINQSLPGVVSRYLLDGQPGGDIFWGPDNNTYAKQVDHGWIAFASLEPSTVRLILRIAQLLIFATLAWAVGWKKRPRDDARRGLHYAMILMAMLLLNQRTWDHHAAPILLGVIAIWYAIAFGRFSRRVRIAALTLTLLAGCFLWLSAGDLLVIYARIAGLNKHDAEVWSEVALAYGPRMYTFLLLFISATVLAVTMKRSDPPYSDQRQTLAADVSR